MFELIFGVVLEIFVNVVIASLFDWGWRSVVNVARPAKEANKFLAVSGLLVLGGLTGALSVWALGGRMTPVIGFSGLSLVVAPLIAGVLLKLVGSLLESNGVVHTPITTWWGGAAFAFAVAWGRFALLG